MSDEVRIEPDSPVRAGEWGTWRIVYTAASRGLAIGGGVMVGLHQQLLPVFHLEGDWTPFQCNNPGESGYITAQCQGKANPRIEVIKPGRIPGLPEPTPRLIRVKIEESPLLGGEELLITLGDTSQNSPGIRAQMIAESAMKFFVSVDYEGNDCWDPLVDLPALDIFGGPVVQLRAIIPSVVLQGKLIPLSVHALDAFGHPASGVNEESCFVLSEEQDSKHYFLNEPTLLSMETSGIHRVQVSFGEYRAESNPVLVTKTEPKYKVYWGDIHGHSNFSDGLRSPDNYFQYARDVSRLDFAVLTDHEPGFGPNSRMGSKNVQINNVLWDQSKQMAVAYHDSGKFVTFCGYEWTSAKYGHKCIYFLTEDQQVFPAWDPKTDTPEKLYGVLPENKAMVVTHHPGGGPAPADLSLINPDWEPLVEIYSCHGCSDQPGVGRPLWRTMEGKGFYVQEALNQGFPFGIIAGSDTHTSDPGNPIIKHPLFPHPYRVGLMAVFAPELTRESLWNAFWERRVYGTTGERILLDFRINNQMMGSSVTVNHTANVSIIVAGTCKLSKIDLICNGKLIKTSNPGNKDFIETRQNMALQPGYYYVRVTQTDAEMAWSSPIWVTINQN